MLCCGTPLLEKLDNLKSPDAGSPPSCLPAGCSTDQCVSVKQSLWFQGQKNGEDHQ